ncbi:MAG TPA: hypothetical protein VLG09_02145 [Candidatus Saccharimonadales bacterium]|nr:hypothetical protein [Candidatus Saccharimonadales bacterium]
MIDVTVTVSDFTTVPGGRFIEQGDGSAEEFFKDWVQPKLVGPKKTKLIINMQNTWGYGPSFTSQLGIYLKKYFGGVQEVHEHVAIEINNPATYAKFWSQLEDDA